MSLEFRCPGCGKRLIVGEQFAGRRALCNGCGTMMIVPPLAAIPPTPYPQAQYPPAAYYPAPPQYPAPPYYPNPQAGWPQYPVPQQTAPPVASPAAAPGKPRLRLRFALPRPGLASRNTRWYLLFILTLVPLAFSLLTDKGDDEERLERTLKAHPEILSRISSSDGVSREAILSKLPEGKIEGAHLSVTSPVHWFYAIASVALFSVMLLVFFPLGKAAPGQILLVGSGTATFGIVLLVCVQLIASATQGWYLTGGNIIILVLFYVVKFIGFSYSAALDPDTNFLLSFFGFTFGVGLCEELTKVIPILYHFHKKPRLDWRGACIWGLVSGVGFGVAEGILYSWKHYNGIATAGIYPIRFISCVALHAIWGGAAAIMVWQRRNWIKKDNGLGDMLATTLSILAVPMVLHGLYDTLLKKEMSGLALVAAIASFVWLAFTIERARLQQA